MAKIKSFNKLKTNDKLTDQNMQLLEQSINSIVAQLILGGQIIGPIAMTGATPTTLSHGLGKNYTGCIPFSIYGADAIFQESTSPDRSQFIVITASDSVTAVSFFVF